MKSLIWIIGAIALAGCGKVALNGNRIGQSIKFEPVSIAPSSELSSICDAIMVKTAALAGNGSYFHFDLAEKECYDPDLPSAKQPAWTTETFQASVDIRTGGNGGVYYFRRTDGRIFFDVETTGSGAVSAICNSLSDLKSQIKLNDGQVITFSTSVLTTDCSAGFGQKCLQISYYSPVNGSTGTYKNHTNEYLKFNVNGQLPRQGFWAERKKVSHASCGGVFQLEQVGKLK